MNWLTGSYALLISSLRRFWIAVSLQIDSHGTNTVLITRYIVPIKKLNTLGVSVLFVGGCAPRKGLHYALAAWLQSPAHYDGKFVIAGEFVPGYAEKLALWLSDPSVHVLGHRNDVAELMRAADILILPSIEEGSALVTSEARGSGCVLLVSEAAGAICKHGENALVHGVGDVDALSQHITLLYQDRVLLEKLRTESLRTVNEITWTAAGRILLDVYRETIEMKKRDSKTREYHLAGTRN